MVTLSKQHAVYIRKALDIHRLDARILGIFTVDDVMTEAELDRSFSLAAGSDGVYTAADGALPEGGHWNIQIEEPERRWRLVASAKGFTQPVAFESATP